MTTSKPFTLRLTVVVEAKYGEEIQHLILPSNWQIACGSFDPIIIDVAVEHAPVQDG